MRRLFLYSDQVISENRVIDALLVKELNPTNPTIGYISSEGVGNDRFFFEKQEYYNEIGIKISISYDLNSNDTEALGRLFACDAIHLSGGNTRIFLERIRRSGIEKRLISWANDKGVLVGTSAGAILMTPNIACDSLFDGNTPVKIDENKALNLVPFQFFPHLNQNSDFADQLIEFSRKYSQSILACPDGSGAMINGDQLTIVGDAYWYQNGEVRPAVDVNIREI